MARLATLVRRARLNLTGTPIPATVASSPRVHPTPYDRVEAGKCSSAKEVQRLSCRASNPALLSRRITHRITIPLQRSAHRTADLGTAIEARL